MNIVPQRKLDMGQAWNEATSLMSANRDTISAIAGLLFFVPALLLAFFAPELSNPGDPSAAASDSDPQAAVQAVMDQMSAAYAKNWPLIALVTVLQFLGSLSLLALLTDRSSPTVAEALKLGAISIPSYLAAQILAGFAAGAAVGVPLGLLAITGSGVAIGLGAFAAMLLALYLVIKFVLIAPVIATEGVRNPITALGRSWRLTKGNSVRIALFLVLLFVTIGIIALLITLVLNLIFAAMGDQIAQIGSAVVDAAINTVLGVVLLMVTAAVHRQLAGASPQSLAQPFE
jgi:hypothetical protein